MLRYKKIDASEGINVNKTSASKNCELCHYWIFKNIRFKFVEHVCNGCHDLLKMAYLLENITILSAKGATFRFILWGISRNEGLKRLNSFVLENKVVLQMKAKAEQIKIINQAHYNYYDIIRLKNFDPIFSKIDRKQALIKRIENYERICNVIAPLCC